MCKVDVLLSGYGIDKIYLWLVFATQGVNKVSIRKIVEEDRLVTIEEAFLCINDKELHPLLRSAYIDFIISTLVDVNVEESGTTVENIWHTFVSLTHAQYFTNRASFCAVVKVCVYSLMLFSNDKGLEQFAIQPDEGHH